MYSRRNRPQHKIYTTNVGDLIIRGSASQIITKCEGLGYEAQRAKDEVLAHRFLQTADHYKRIENDTINQ